MKLHKRKNGSQRCATPIKVELWPNSVGQGGDASLTFRLENGDWLWIEFETEAEARQLMSQSQMIFRNLPEGES